MEIIESRKCTSCQIVKSLSEFHKSSKGKNGYREVCKVCRKLKEPYSAQIDYQRAYRERNRERLKPYFKKYNSLRKDKQSIYYIFWKRENVEHFRIYQKSYYQKNRLHRISYVLQYAKTHPENIRVNHQRRRGRKIGRGVFTVAEWQQLKDFYNRVCLCCGLGEPLVKLCADHVIPLSRGGMNTIDNIQPLCRKCNSHKATKSTDYRKAKRRL